LLPACLPLLIPNGYSIKKTFFEFTSYATVLPKKNQNFLKNAVWAKIIVEVFEQSFVKRKRALKKENEKALDLSLKLKERLKDPKGGGNAIKKRF
jgi:hypothetical protein